MADDVRSRILELPPKRLALFALELQEELERERAAGAEPLAVVGMGCRFPGGADSPDAYWRMLEEGRDVIDEVPEDRWSADALYDPDPDAPGRIATRWGGYLDDVQSFDAAFFSISPREARAMDPQQRILMEVTWRAFEDAAIPPSRLHARRAGVFVGLCNNDYLTRLLKEGPEAIDAYLSSGNAYSVAAGRLSFTFGFQGPAVTVDTACSSSLVALHQACRSLRAGESELAVAAGVNVMCSPETAMALSRARMMAPDGRCKTFDDAADGFVRAEGCGVVLLKRLTDARRDGDRIHALIRGSALGQDGRSTGLTVPNGPAQEQVLRDALGDALLDPDDVDYIEAHGTGTSLGDPIEIRALGRVFGPGRDRPLYVGSVKTNMGHLESAAGVAGVIKAILAVREGRIPPHLHFRTPSAHIEWDEYPIEVPAEGMAWPSVSRPRRAGVSSFGFSGTNAHVLVEEAPDGDRTESADVRELPFELLPISGFTPGARDRVSDAYVDALRSLPAEGFGDFCHTARVGRTALGWRRAVVVRDAAEAEEALTGSDGAPALIEGADKAGDSPELAFLFTGQGAQSPGMGRGLYESVAPFRKAIDRCAEVLDPILPLPLTEALFEGEGDAAPIYSTTVAQPAVVAFEWSLAQMWDAWGVRPAALLGHSLGEFVAACIADVLTLEDTLRLVAERGRLLDSLPRGDRMAAIFAPAERVEVLMAGHEDVAAIAAYNGPENTVVSGIADVVTAIVDACAAEGIESRELRLDRGFHSPRVEPILDELDAFAARFEHRPPSLPLVWNVTGESGGATPPPRGYWREHARRPVRFLQGVRALGEMGVRHFLEVGPHPTLSPLVAQTLETERPVLVPSLRRDGDSCREAAEALARLWVEGVEVDFEALDPAHRRRRVAIPGHPFERERYWVDPPAVPRSATPRGALPGVRLSTAVPIHETLLTPDAPSFLSEHLFRGEAVVPGPVYAEAAREAALAVGLRIGAVADLELVAPAFVGRAGLRLQTVLEEEDGVTRFRVLSLASDAQEGARWSEHARGVLPAAASRAAPHRPSAPREREAVSADEHLERLRGLGFELGRSAARWSDLVVGPAWASARLLPSEPAVDAAFGRALLLDAAVQVLGAAVARDEPLEPRMLAGVEEIVWVGDAGTAVRCVAVTREPGVPGSVGGDVVLLDPDDRAVGWLRGVRLAAAPEPRVDASDWYYRVEWLPSEVEERVASLMAEDALEAASVAVDEAWSSLSDEAGLEAYVDDLPRLSGRVADHVAGALAAMGLDVGPGDPIPEDLVERLHVGPAHRQLFPRLLEILVTGGYLSGSESSAYTVAKALEAPPAPDGEEAGPVQALVERCGRALADVLTGEVDPLTLLFPEGGGDTTRAVYRDTPFGRAYNEALRVALEALVPTETGSPVRVLEVGAGSGTTTEAALAGLGKRSVRYVFTDLSPTLVAAAERELGGRDGLEFRALDLESDPDTQGIASGSQDVVIAANVVHATDALSRSLGHLHRMLAPGGALLLLEGTRPEPWVDITFGLTAGWWRFADRDLRPTYPLLPVEGWVGALESCGFCDVRSAPSDELAQGAGQVLLMARKPATRAVVSLDPESPLAASLSAAGHGRGSSGREVVFDARGRTGAELVEDLPRVLDPESGGRLRVVTEGAQESTPGEETNPDQAIFWGLARCFALEHPDRWAGIVDVAPGTPDDEVTERLIAEMGAGGDEDQVAWRGPERRVPRLVRAAVPADAPITLEPGTYLVTGGLGGLGLKVAAWLASRGAERLVLTGRTAALDDWRADDPRRADLAALDAEGVEVLIRAADVTDREAVDELLEEVRASGPPMRGIVHAAAVFDDGPIEMLSRERLEAVLAPKVRGAQNLAAATAGDPLDFLVLFSSTTSILGVAGLASYAAANQYADAFPGSAGAEGRPVVSIAWGIWDEMRLASEEDRERYGRAGLRPMPSEAALDAMGRVLASDAKSIVVADVDWDRLRGLYESRRRRPILERVGRSEEQGLSELAGPSVEETGLDGLAGLPPDERLERLLGVVEEQVRHVLRLPADRSIDAAEGFFAMGMDSLMSVELKSRLEDRLSTRLPSTLTFNYPSVVAVAEFLNARVVPDGTARAAAVDDGRLDAARTAEANVSGARRVREEGAPEDESEDALARLLESRLERLERGETRS